MPKYLNYRPGSSYFGGEYEQTSINGGTQGNIIDSSQGEFKKPILNEPTVTNNEDGTQTLTWTLTDVEIGKPMAPIYYSADIGKKGNQYRSIDRRNSQTNPELPYAEKQDRYIQKQDQRTGTDWHQSAQNDRYTGQPARRHIIRIDKKAERHRIDKSCHCYNNIFPDPSCLAFFEYFFIFLHPITPFCHFLDQQSIPALHDYYCRDPFCFRITSYYCNQMSSQI